MSTRRDFLKYCGSGVFGIFALSAISPALGAAVEKKMQAFKGREIFDRILAKALAKKWDQLPIGQLMGNVAMELRGTPYVGFTLELSKDDEICSVNLTGLDCVTFFEDTLDFSRMLKKGGRSPNDMLAQIAYTRYRGGKVSDFTSRLHYTTDWFYDNQNKGVIKILAPELPGAAPFTQKVGIMSQQPDNYPQLAAHPNFVPKIQDFENQINSRSLMYIPMDKLSVAQEQLQTGDIIGVCTTEEGIDIAHTGLIYKDNEGVPHFMDASSSRSKMRVTLEKGPVSGSLNWSKKLTGAMFARPLEPA